jgi:hypothetical protein
MTTFEIAYIHEQGVDLIIVLVDSSFGYKARTEQDKIVERLHACATLAGLAGTVITVWDSGGGQMHFLAPHNWHPFFSSIDLTFVIRNINRKLTCDL